MILGYSCVCFRLPPFVRKQVCKIQFHSFIRRALVLLELQAVMALLLYDFFHDRRLCPNRVYRDGTSLYVDQVQQLRDLRDLVRLRPHVLLPDAQAAFTHVR